MKNIKLFLGFTGILIGFMLSNELKALDIMGGEITWTCVGQDSFVFKVVVYRDCNGGIMGNNMMDFVCKSTGVTINNRGVSPSGPIDITPTCSNTCTRCSNPSCSFPFGIQQYSASYLIGLYNAGSCCEINIYFYMNSRSSSITSGSAGEIFHLTEMLNRCATPDDNSPVFSKPPCTILCIGDDAIFDFSASDPDHNSTGGSLDSLTYEWAPPLQGGGAPTSWISGYSYKAPIYFWGFPNTTLTYPKGFHLDTLTGEISFRPMKNEQTIMCLAVSEYRNGVKIGEIHRDIQVIVINCPNNNTPTIVPSTYLKETCPGSPVSFTIKTNDIDSNDILTISWNHGIKGASWTDSNGLAKHPTGTFTWTPDTSKISSLPYSFIVSVKDDACPISGHCTHIYQVQVNPYPKAAITIADLCAGNFYMNAHTLVGTGPVFKWARDSLPDTFSYTGAAILHHFSAPGHYPFTLKMTAHTCTTIYYDTVFVDSILYVSLPKDTQVCSGTIINVKGKYSGAKGKVKMSWNISANDTTNQISLKIDKNTLLIFTVKDTTGCTINDSMLITAIKPLIKIDSLPLLCQNDSILHLDNYVTVNGTKNPGAGKWTSTCAGLVSADRFNPKVSGHGTFMVKYEYTDSLTGCYNNDSSYITVLSLPLIKIDSLPYLCENDPIMHMDNYVTVNSIKKPGAGKWTSHSAGLVSGDCFNPKVSGHGTFKVKYEYSDSLTGCYNSDSCSITVVSLPLIKIDILPFICENDLILHLDNYVTVNGTKNPGAGKWTSNSAGLVSGDCFNPKVSGYGIFKIKYEYTDSLTGCFNHDSSYVVVNSSPHAWFGAFPTNGNMPLNVNFKDSSSISSGSIKSFLWDFGNGDTSASQNPNYTYKTAGTYNIRLSVISDFGCSDTVSRKNYIKTLPSLITDLSESESISITPNPALDYIIISINGSNIKIESVTFTNSLGKIICSYNKLSSKEIKIDRHGIEKGIYFLKIRLLDNTIVYNKVLFE